MLSAGARYFHVDEISARRFFTFRLSETRQHKAPGYGKIILKNAVRQLKLLDLIVEPDEFKVYRIVNSVKQPLELPKLSFELLLYLMAHAEKICSVEQISAAVWKNTVVTDDTITQRITLLRKALDDDPKQPKYIESVRGRGYRLLASPVECATGTVDAKAAAVSTTATPTVVAATASASPSAKRPLRAAVILLLLCLLPLAYWFTQKHPADQVTNPVTAQAGNAVTTLL